ncbi:MAG: hypothetical protein K6G70_10585 [Bacteroidaceae bacterium]|nr:hypothetical protein [Bacteroidaceae bacterium]
MKQFITCLILMLTFAACGDVAKKPSKYEENEIASPQPSHVGEGDGTIEVREETPKAEEKTSAPVSSSPSSSSYHSSSSYDNMRGFDPASEDDGDDNGMSRYMENDDEEGWE